MVFKRLEVGSTLPGISKSTCLTFRFLLLFALLLFWVFHCLCVFVCMSALSTSNEEKPTHTGTANERGIEWTSGKCMNNAGLPVMKFVFVSQRLLLPSFPAFLPLSLLSLSLPVTLTPARPTRRTTPLLLLLLLLVPRSASRAHFPLYFFDAVAPWISFPLRTSNRSLVSLPGLKIRVRIRIRNEPITETQHSPDFDCNSNTIYALSYWTLVKGA